MTQRSAIDECRSAIDECLAKLDEAEAIARDIDRGIGELRRGMITPEFVWLWMFMVPLFGLALGAIIWMAWVSHG